MVGGDHQMMGFDPSTNFAPYALVRNSGDTPLQVAAEIRVGGADFPSNVALPPLKLNPHEARALDLRAPLPKEFTGVINVAFRYFGVPDQLQIATGSVDNSGSFVLAVKALAPTPSRVRQIPFWSLEGATDTMFNFYNPSATAEDLSIIFYFAGGKYTLPLHIDGNGSAMFNISEIIRKQQPDADGHVIPMSIQHGGLEIMSSKGPTTTFSTISVISTFNVITATCGVDLCDKCDDFVDFWLDLHTFSMAVGDSLQMTSHGQWGDGTIYDCTSNTNWSSSDSNVISIGGIWNGYEILIMATAISPGSITIDGFMPTTREGASCFVSGQCDDVTFDDGAEGDSVAASVSCDSVTRGNTVTCTASAGGPSFTTNSWKFTDSSSHIATGSPTGAIWSGTAVQSGTVSVKVSVDGRDFPASTSLTVTPRSNFAFATVSPTKQSNGYNCGGNVILTAPNPPSDGTLIGRYCDNATYSYNFITIGSNAGPNSGFSYVTSATNTATFNWIIAPDADDPSSQFYRAQCGNYNPTTGTGFIGGATLQADTTRHESGAVQSHYNNYVVAQNNTSNNIGVGLEAAVDQSAGQDFQTFVSNFLNSRISALHSATAVEPCNTEFVMYNQSCVYDGPLNVAPYASCN
jgi:hypothetical protein